MKNSYTFTKSVFAFLLCFILFLPRISFATSVNDTQTEGLQDSGEATTEKIYYQTTEYPDEPSRVPDIGAETAIVMDAKTGQILYEKDAYKKMYPASITKILTALVALENGDLDSTVTMSVDAVYGIEFGSSHIALDVDEEISLKDALYAVLLVSANEAAWGVAEHIGGTLENFCDMMNERAKELGCTGTHFVNANGLHDDDHYTCAYDMALIAKQALTIDAFREITGTIHYTIPPTNIQPEERNLWQDNKLIKDESPYYYEYCEGGKTGFTDQARGTLVTWVKKGDIELICVTMQAYPMTVNYSDTVALSNYCFRNYSYDFPLTDYEFPADAEVTARSFIDSIDGASTSKDFSIYADTATGFLVKSGEESSGYTFNYSFFKSRLDEGIIGTLTIDNGNSSINTPIYCENYDISAVNPEQLSQSSDEENVTGTLAPLSDDNDSDLTISEAEPSEENEENSEKNRAFNFKLVIPVIVVLCIAALAAGLILRARYVQKKREEYKKSRDMARKRKEHF